MKTANVSDEVWDRIERAARDQQLVSAPVVGVAGGFLTLDLWGVLVGMPLAWASHGPPYPAEAYVGATLSFVIREVNRDRGNVLGSAQVVYDSETQRQSPLDDGRTVFERGFGRSTQIAEGPAFPLRLPRERWIGEAWVDDSGHTLAVGIAIACDSEHDAESMRQAWRAPSSQDDWEIFEDAVAWSLERAGEQLYLEVSEPGEDWVDPPDGQCRTRLVTEWKVEVSADEPLPVRLVELLGRGHRSVLRRWRA
jgi:hypothetical protein